MADPFGLGAANLASPSSWMTPSSLFTPGVSAAQITTAIRYENMVAALLNLGTLGLAGDASVAFSGQDLYGNAVGGRERVVAGIGTAMALAPAAIAGGKAALSAVRGASRVSGAKGAAAETRLTTVLGSGRDVAPYAKRPGFNVLNMDNLPATEWPRQNALWLNQAIRRGDDIWLVTDPAKHTQLMQQLGKSSYYLDLELPMLQQYNGVNAIPKYITSP
jgi:hypothetical protein